MVDTPFDIIELIIRIVADGDRQALKACSLACKTFLSLARRYLYSTIDFLDTREDAERREKLTRRFNLLLDQTPEIGLLVRALSFKVQESDFVDLEVQHLLGRLPKLVILFLYPQSFDLAWHTLPDPFRSVLVDLIHLPTLTHVTMMYFTELPLSVLATAGQLEHLTLTDVEFQPIDIDTFSTGLLDPSRDRPHLKNLKLGYQNMAFMGMFLQPLPPSTLTPFNMSTMEIFKVHSQSLRDMQHIRGILALAGEALKSLELNVKQNEIYALELSRNSGLQILSIILHASEPDEDPVFNLTDAQARSNNTFDLGCAPDLQSLSIRFSHSDREENSLYGLIHTLAQAIRTPFLHLTSISIQISFDAEGSFEPCWDSDSWRRFDTALVDSGFPALRKVIIESRTSFDAIIQRLCNRDEMLQLKARRFPLLSAKREVNFDFNTLVWNTRQGRHMEIL